MKTARYFAFFGLLSFLSAGVFAEGLAGVLSRSIISPQTQKRSGCSIDCLRQGRQYTHNHRVERVSARVPLPDTTQTRNANKNKAHLYKLENKDSDEFSSKHLAEGGKDAHKPANTDFAASGLGISQDGAASHPSSCGDKKGSQSQELDKYAGCPEGFVGHQDKCYKLFPLTKTWSMSRIFCRVLYGGGDLASISSQEQYDFISREFADTGSEPVWIGMYKTPSGPFRWANGEQVREMPYDPNEANESKGHVALTLDNFQFLLNDDSQRIQLHHFLCSTPRFAREKEASGSIPANTEADSHSEKRVPGTNKSRKSSSKTVPFAKDDKGVPKRNSPAAKDPTQNIFAAKRNAKNSRESGPGAKIGLKQTTRSNVAVKQGEKGSTKSASRNRAANNFEKRAPAVITTGKDSSNLTPAEKRLKTGQVTGETAADFTGHVPIRADKDASAVPNSQERSPNAKQVAEDSVTSIVDAEHVSEDSVTNVLDAEQVSEDSTTNVLDAEQVSEDSATNVLDAEQVSEDSATNVLDAEQVSEDSATKVLDAEQVSEDSVTSVLDAEEVSEDSVTSIVDAEQIAENSVISTHDAGQRVRDSKISVQENAMDTNEKDAVKTKKAVLERNSKCERGWKEFEDQCYKAFFTNVAFQEANRKCLKRGAQLVSLHSAPQSAFVSSEVMKRRPQSTYWIGLAGDKNGLRWTDGSPVDYTYLSPESNRLYRESRLSAAEIVTLQSSIEECFAISYSKEVWTPLKCETKMFYICRKAKGAGVPFQERSGPIPLDVSHEDKLAMFDQKQKSISTKTQTGRWPNAASILGATVGLVALVTVMVSGVISWYRNNGNYPAAWKWTRLQKERTSSAEYGAAHNLENVHQYLALGDSENETVDDNQTNMYGTINGTIY